MRFTLFYKETDNSQKDTEHALYFLSIVTALEMWIDLERTLNWGTSVTRVISQTIKKLNRKKEKHTQNIKGKEIRKSHEGN